VANAPGAWGNGSSDPMYNSYIYPFNGGNVVLTVTNLPTGQYDLYVYGIDSSYQVDVGAGHYGVKSLGNAPVVNPVVWQEGVQYVVFRNVQVLNGGPAAVLTVLPGSGGYATLSGIQLASVSAMNHAPTANSQSKVVDQNSTNSIVLTGSDLDGDALTFTVLGLPTHGSLTGTPPNLTYVPLVGYSGTDSFTFKASDGQADSGAATVSITVRAAGTSGLINVDFGAGSSTTEVGPAATGQAASDFWNFYTRDDGHRRLALVWGSCRPEIR